MASNFQMLAQKLASQGVKNPGGLAYSIGAKKYGSATMAKAAATSTPAAVVAKKARK